MKRKSLLNQLELAYAPLTAYEFAQSKNDAMIEKALETASLYAIGQRPVITFENVFMEEKSSILKFEIHQKGNPNILKGSLSVIQSIVGLTHHDEIAAAFNFLDKSKKQKKPPFYNIHGFSLLKCTKKGNEFKIWFSPEKFLQNWWKGNIDCKIDGNFKSFCRYKILYVGKATKQCILKRLSGHSTFQDILSLEAPVTEKQLPANEIVVLPFKFFDNLQIHTFDFNSDIDKMVSAIQGDDYPEQEKVFLDAEKALIKSIEPGYNKELFRSYPISKDGLFNDNYDIISYTFTDPITLKYFEGEIVGGITPIGGDSIVIIGNNEMKLIKHEN